MPKSSQLTITVTPELEAFILERVASGRFDTASDAKDSSSSKYESTSGKRCSMRSAAKLS
jgi:hypothetical protein